MKKILIKIKNKFNENKNRNMLILIIIILTILSSITLITYSFYQNRSSNLIIAGVASIDKSDVRIKVYRENKDDDGLGIGTYSLSYYIPEEAYYIYNSNKTSCDTGITINKYENRIFYMDATKKGQCEVYFDAIDGYIDDYEVNLFVQQEIGNTDDKNYEQMGQLPLYETGYYYTVNTLKTSCTSLAKVKIVGTKVNIFSSVKTICDVYADKNTDSVSPTIGDDLKVENNILTVTLNDNAMLGSYGLSSSSDTEPEEWFNIPTTPYTLSTSITSDTPYLWVKDAAGNAKVSSEISFKKTFNQILVASNKQYTSSQDGTTYEIADENGIRYEGANPDNYICLDNKTDGSCSSTSLLFRIIGLFDEDTSIDGTNSSGTKKLLKIIDTNNYGGTSGVAWNSSESNNWSTSSLETELNGTYLTALLGTTNVYSKLSSTISKAKWHLGGASSDNYKTLTAEKIYVEERNSSAVYSGNPSSIYVKVGLMYPSDYGYATVGGSTTNKSACNNLALYEWNNSSYSDCKNNNWLFTSQTGFIDSSEWVITPNNSFSAAISTLKSSGNVNMQSRFYGIQQYRAYYYYYPARPVMYIYSDKVQITGGNGSQTNPYHIN